MQRINLEQTAPEFTVITVVYNNEKFIRQTIESVLAQKDVSLEYIIVDGNSTDGTLDIIREYVGKIDKVISEKDKGIYDAMNKGIINSTGKWLIFMNSGDLFFSNDTLSRITEVINENFDIIYGSFCAEEPHIKKLVKFEAGTPSGLLNGMIMNHQACIIKAKYHQENLYDLSYKVVADYDFMLGAYQNKASFLRINHILANIATGGVSDGNRTNTFREMKKVKLYRRLSSTTVIKSYLRNIAYANTIKAIKLILPKSLFTRLIEFKYKRNII